MTRVLVVEDERIVAHDLRQTLVESGFEVTATVESGEDAIVAAREERPDVVLMDVRLEGAVDGIEAARTIGPELDVPVVFLTASTDSATHERLRPHAAALLMKPYDAAELPRVLLVALERHQDSRTERRRRQDLASTLACVGDPLFTTDRSGTLEFVNAAGLQLLGVTRSEVLRRAFGDVVSLRDRDGAVLRDPTQAALEREAGQPLELDAFLERGSIPVSVTAAPIVEGARLLGAVVVLRDLSARMEAQNQLAHAERLIALGTMAAGVAHEVSSPLTSLVANLDWIGDHALSSPVREVLQESSYAARLITRLVQDLRTMSGPHAPAMVHFDLGPVLLRAIRLIRAGTNADVSIESDLPSGLAVYGDPVGLCQVAMNLLSNAVDAARLTESGAVKVRAQTEPEGLSFSVIDAGPGIPSDLKYRVFEPFFTTKGVGKGTGLGLSISSNIVRAHGGELVLRPVQPHGTEAVAHLPTPGPQGKGMKSEGTPGGASGGTVLLVDDDPLLLRAVARQLEATHEVVTAVKAPEAIEVLEQSRVNAVVCDVMMPEVNGLELARRCFARFPEVRERWLFMSGGLIQAALHDQIAELGRPLLRKPFELSTLLTHLRELGSAPGAVSTD